MSNSVRPHRRQPTRLPVPGILQARTLEWVAIAFSNAWKWKVKVKSLSHVRLFTTQWTAAYQAPPSMGFSRQECWSGVPLPSLINAVRYANLTCSWIYKKVTLYSQLNALICPVLVSIFNKVLEIGLNNLKEISESWRLRFCDCTLTTHL